MSSAGGTRDRRSARRVSRPGSQGSPSVNPQRALTEARTAYDLGDTTALATALERGLEHTRPGSSLEAHLRALQARRLMWERPAVEEARAALRLAAASGTSTVQARIALGTALYLLGDARGVTQLRRAEREAASATDRADARLMLGVAFFSLSRPRAARAICARLSRDPAARRRPALLAAARYFAARSAIEADADYGFAIPEMQALLQTPIGLSRPELVGSLAMALADVGKEDAARQLLDMDTSRPTTRWARAYLLYARSEVEWAAGRLERAAAIAGECAAMAAPPLIAYALMVRGWARTESGLAPDLPELDQGWPTAASRTEARGLRALATGRFDEAQEAFIEAAVVLRSRSVREQLRSLWAAAVVAQRRGDPSAARLRERVRRRAAAVGLHSILRRIEGESARPRRLPLSDRQRAVVDLVGEGLSSRAIARRLRLSTPTVEAHLRAAMAKLGASTRLQAVAITASPMPRRAALAPPEQRVVELLADGETVANAAALLYVSRRTLTRLLEQTRRRNGIVTNAQLIFLLPRP